ncbi:MAG: cysteine--tRNA ligase [Erysipelotrichaceae bacterium]|nr:cysteine--tRNA ligase [Erysipelotrichaceae bacterium]
MKLYNSKSLQMEELKPVVEGEVSMYVCGPTVYNHVHIGNARPIVVFDTLRRVLEEDGYKVKYVSNYTDVDDKIINKALEEGVEERVIANRYMEAYDQVRKMLHTIPLSAAPQVTQTMDDIIEFVKQLVDEGYAYEVDGDVFFSVDKIKGYGQLSHQNIEELQVGARIDENSKKRNPLDFALWKQTEAGIKWDSYWGKGRPGWHTECVVMIGKEFDHHMIDIHGGGKDLKFPHHENEVAQSIAVNHHSLANIWMHNGMLNLNGGKMSKSMGNVMWAKDEIARLGSNFVRWILLSARYRDSLNYSEEAIEAAQKEFNKVYAPWKQATLKAILQDVTLDEHTIDIEHFERFMDAMRDDLNTPNAYAEIFETTKVLNQSLRVREVDWVQVGKYLATLNKMLSILGIVFEPIVVTDEDKMTYRLWNEAKSQKDFAKADEYRLQLTKKGLL